MRYWGNEQFERPATYDSICLAVAKHDIGWIESDKEILFNQVTGQPIPFINVNLRQHVDFYGKGYEQVKEEDPYAGLLVGMHWIGLYTSRFGYDPSFTYKTPDDLVSFMKETIIAQQKAWVELKMKLWSKDEPRSRFEDKLWMDYELVQLMDRLSQYVSMRRPETTDQLTLGPVRMTLDGSGVMLSVQGRGSGVVEVDPFPFEDVVETTVMFRKIPDIRYGSHAEVCKAIEEAEAESALWKFVPAR